MKEKGHVITLVRSGSLAEELELSKGDVLLEINGHKIEDIFDYQYFMEDTYVELLVRKQDGEECFWRWRRMRTRIWAPNLKTA